MADLKIWNPRGAGDFIVHTFEDPELCKDPKWVPHDSRYGSDGSARSFKVAASREHSFQIKYTIAGAKYCHITMTFSPEAAASYEAKVEAVGDRCYLAFEQLSPVKQRAIYRSRVPVPNGYLHDDQRAHCR